MAKPEFCDVILKGGITSGVVYPLAVVALSKQFRFKNVGGASAGAIAAALTAAAEHRRRTQNSEAGFEALAALPEWLGENEGEGSRLFQRFQPSPATKPLFEIAAAALGKQPVAGVIAAALRACRVFPMSAWRGVTPGLILLLAALELDGNGPLRLCVGLFGLVATVLGLATALLVRVAGCASRSLPSNFYGLCTGRSSEGSPVALTDWLEQKLDDVAGHEDAARPLTFGDLWGAGHDQQHADINLEMLTTNLSHGRPHRLPFAEKVFFFRREEFARLFSERVVDWLLAHPHQGESPNHPGFDRLPDAALLPVVVAARMSLSFPILLSAVPLYALDYDRNPDGPPERCWFSDGGICSNFPVHFFDTPLPGWPTFAFNLRPWETRFEESDGVYLPSDNRTGITEWWTRFESGGGLRRISGFLFSILKAMHDWRDNVQAQMPGYRDRVANVGLRPQEGGLNLNMDAEAIGSLADRGKRAAEVLAQRFANPAASDCLTWDNHRWVRLRSLLGLLQEWLPQISEILAKEPNPRTSQKAIDAKFMRNNLCCMVANDNQFNFSSLA
jgi:predicted acylesterase/phospholipase RssA